MKMKRLRSGVRQMCAPLSALLLVSWGVGACDDGAQGTCACPDAERCDADGGGEPLDTEVARDTLTADSTPEDTGGASPSDAHQAPTCPWIDHGEGLRGGQVATAQFDPRVPGIVFATSGQVLYRSSDAGLSWSRWSESDAGFTRLGFPASDPKAVVAIGASGLWESLDSALSFEPKALSGLPLYGLVVHPALDQRLFVGSDGAGLLRSDDAGESWRPYNVGFPRARVRSLVGDPSDPEVVLAGVNLQSDAMGSAGEGQLLRTGDGGRRWEVVLDGIGWGADIAFCPLDPQIVWAAVRHGVARSEDGGLSWSLVSGFGDKDALALAVDPSDCERVWVAVYREGLYRSEDGGATALGPFTEGFQIQLTALAPSALVIDPGGSGRLLAATHGGLYRSEDQGESWILTEVGDSISVSDLAASPATSGELWLSSWGSGVWVKRGLEAAWERVSVDALPRDFAFSVHPDPGDSSRVFVGSSPELWLSGDGGASFESLELRHNVLSLAFLEGPAELLAGTQTRGFFSAGPGGQEWTESNGDLTPWETNNGTFIDIRAITPDPDDPQLIVAGTKGHGILRTTDRGVTWQAVGGAELSDQIVRVVLRAALPSPRWYALVESRGVYVSYDDGVTWARTGTELDSVAIKDLALDEATGFLYLATTDTGIYRSVDGQRWDPFDRYCQPVLGYSYLAVMEAEGQRWLVAIGGGNTVIRHAL